MKDYTMNAVYGQECGMCIRHQHQECGMYIGHKHPTRIRCNAFCTRYNALCCIALRCSVMRGVAVRCKYYSIRWSCLVSQRSVRCLWEECKMSNHVIRHQWLDILHSSQMSNHVCVMKESCKRGQYPEIRKEANRREDVSMDTPFCRSLLQCVLQCPTKPGCLIDCLLEDFVGQVTAIHCNKLQHATELCNTLHHAATRCNARHGTCLMASL